MPKCFKSTPVWRVSSAAMSAQSDNTARARGDRSPRLPIGVATTYNRPSASLATIICALYLDPGAEGYGSDLSTSTAAAPCGAHDIAVIGRLQPGQTGADSGGQTRACAASGSRWQACRGGADLRGLEHGAAVQPRQLR